jgi:hypothetical protein
LSSALGRLATGRLHVLLVEAAGGSRVRMAAEQQLRLRGWRRAMSPADADALLCCGRPGASFEPVIAELWEQLPGPRTRGRIDRPGGVSGALDALAVDYLDVERQRRDARGHLGYQPPGSDPEDGPPGQHEHGEDMAPGHGMDHDHGDEAMAGPGGIALASGGAPARDGLDMDMLHLPLGAGLVGWPAGLLVRCTLQGDVLTEVEVGTDSADGIAGEFEADDRADPVSDLIYRADAAGRVLQVAGADRLADRLVRSRDRLLAGTPAAHEQPVFAGVRRRIARAGMLRWSLRNVGVITADTAAERGWPNGWVGDVYDRLRGMLAPGAVAWGRAADLPEVLPGLLIGTEIGAARLTVASLAGTASPEGYR